MFEAALNLRWSDLSRDLVPVIALSTMGCALRGRRGKRTGDPARLAARIRARLRALICADPISVIALIGIASHRSARPLIEAESLFNDGAAAVLFTLILVWTAHGPASAQDGRDHHDVRHRRWRRYRRGIGVGLIAVMIAGTSEDHLVETALTVVAAFGSFLIAEHFGASGVLASVAAGMTMGNLGVLMPKERFGLSITRTGGRSCSNSGNSPRFWPIRWCSC